MNKKLISKILAICAAHFVFYITMLLTGRDVASASAISQSLKWLSFNIHEQYGVWTLICIAFMADSFFKRIL
jgi:hypothetical protein